MAKSIARQDLTQKRQRTEPGQEPQGSLDVFPAALTPAFLALPLPLHRVPGTSVDDREDGWFSKHLQEVCWVVLSQAKSWSGSRRGFSDTRSTGETCSQVFSLVLPLLDFLLSYWRGVSFGPVWVKTRLSPQCSLQHSAQVLLPGKAQQDDGQTKGLR